jgi:hypothetical protein
VQFELPHDLSWERSALRLGMPACCTSLPIALCPPFTTTDQQEREYTAGDGPDQ